MVQLQQCLRRQKYEYVQLQQCQCRQKYDMFNFNNVYADKNMILNTSTFNEKLVLSHV